VDGGDMCQRTFLEHHIEVVILKPLAQRANLA
jgi:hypothetical protein